MKVISIRAEEPTVKNGGEGHISIMLNNASGDNPVGISVALTLPDMDALAMAKKFEDIAAFIRERVEAEAKPSNRYFRIETQPSRLSRQGSAIYVQIDGVRMPALLDKKRLSAALLEAGELKQVTEEGLVIVRFHQSPDPAISIMGVRTIAAYSREMNGLGSCAFAVPFDSQLARAIICLPEADYKLPEKLETKPIMFGGVQAREFNLYEFYQARNSA